MYAARLAAREERRRNGRRKQARGPRGPD
eukprot:COSAG06_NODE_37950_length_429_cov_0.815152_1_plen_28_part_10